MKRVIEMSCAGLIAIALNVGAVAQVRQDRPSNDPLQALNASLEQLTAKVYPAIVHIRVASYGSSAQYGSEEKSQSLTKQYSLTLTSLFFLKRPLVESRIRSADRRWKPHLLVVSKTRTWQF